MARRRHSSRALPARRTTWNGSITVTALDVCVRTRSYPGTAPRSDLQPSNANGGSAIGTLVKGTTGFVMLLHLPTDRSTATVAVVITVDL